MQIFCNVCDCKQRSIWVDEVGVPVAAVSSLSDSQDDQSAESCTGIHVSH